MASTAAPSAPFLSPRPIQRDGGQGGGLGDPHQLHGQVAVGDLLLRRHGREDPSCSEARQLRAPSASTCRGRTRSARRPSRAALGLAVRRGRARDVLAAVDVGTNSVHLVVARLGEDDRFDVLDPREGDGAARHRLGRHEASSTADAIERGVAALARCRRIADSFDAPVRAVATSAVREAENHGDFLDRARARGRHRGRDRLGRRGGPPHPPRRAPGAADLRAAVAACATSAAAAPSSWSGERGEPARRRPASSWVRVRLTNRFFAGAIEGPPVGRVVVPAPRRRDRVRLRPPGQPARPRGRGRLVGHDRAARPAGPRGRRRGRADDVERRRAHRRRARAGGRRTWSSAPQGRRGRRAARASSRSGPTSSWPAP